MADLSDVSNALVSLVAQLLYPNGTGQASAVSAPVRVYVGWPQSQQLNTDLAAGYCHVSVFPADMERVTTRFVREWQQDTPATPTLTLTLTNNTTVTVSGTVSVCNASLLIGNTVYVYAVQATDTTTTIATALAALISGATSSANVITLPSTANLKALRVGVTGSIWRELRRQERVYQLAIWAPTPVLRDAIAQIIDPALMDYNFISLADNSLAKLTYKGTRQVDDLQKSGLFRRDLNYFLEYATIETATGTQVTDLTTNINKVVDSTITSASATVSTFQQNS